MAAGSSVLKDHVLATEPPCASEREPTDETPCADRAWPQVVDKEAQLAALQQRAAAAAASQAKEERGWFGGLASFVLPQSREAEQVKALQQSVEGLAVMEATLAGRRGRARRRARARKGAPTPALPCPLVHLRMCAAPRTYAAAALCSLQYLMRAPRACVSASEPH